MVSDATPCRGWFDAHLDLAYLAECGRDMAAPLDPAMSPHPPASVTLRAMSEGGVRACLGTIFTEATDVGQRADYPTTAYRSGDAEAAHAAGLRQLRCYERWRELGLIRQMPRRGGGAAREGGGPGVIELGILMECADPIREPEELSWWVDRGVVAIGLSWWKSSRYAAGNGADGGLTDLGRALIAEMDGLGVVLDLSHLNERATQEALESTDRPVIASHSNARALIDGVEERHLADETIAEIGRRGGVIGLNLCAPFLVPAGGAGGSKRGATIEDCVRHIEHICEVHGSRSGVGLGSDMDGGFSADDLPGGIRSPGDLEKIARALSRRGWSEREIDGFRSGNWRRFWGARV